MNVDEFDFELPDSLIAQDPPQERGGSRLLVVHRTGGIEHTAFANLAEYLVPGDLLVVNNTRVFPARLLGRRVPSGGGVECLLLRELPTSNRWDALVHPGQKLKTGARMVFERAGITVHGEVLAMHFQGRRTIRLWTDHRDGLANAIDRVGHIPLPPYIKRGDAASDRERYQTVYARERGSVAAPTAGLHFTAGQLASLALRGVERVEVTLHVGYGTFKPVKVDRVEDHVIDPEQFIVPAETAGALTRAKRERRRIIARGPTGVRRLD